MKWNKVSALAASLALAGCTSVPPFTEYDPVSVEDVVANINCEIADIASAPFIANAKYGWTAGVTLNLKTFQSATAGLDATLTVPFSPRTFVATVGGAFQGSAEGKSTVEYQSAVASARCGQSATVAANGGIEGDLGIRDWVESLQMAIRKNYINPTKLSYNVEFVVDKSGSLVPKFSALPIRTAILDIGPKLLGNKKHTHTLTLVLTPTQADAGPLEVVVVRQPKFVARRKSAVPSGQVPPVIDPYNLQTLRDEVGNQTKEK